MSCCSASALRAAIGRLTAMRPQFRPTVAMRRALEGALLVREGRVRDATVAYRDALERLRRVGERHKALLVDLDIAAEMPPGDPLSRQAAAEVRAFVGKTGAVVFEQQLHVRLAEAARGHPTGPRGQQARRTREAETSLTAS